MAERRERRAGSRGWLAATVGFVLVIGGIGVILWHMISVSPVTLPLDNTTFIGAGVAAAGFAAFAIGFERARPV